MGPFRCDFERHVEVTGDVMRVSAFVPSIPSTSGANRSVSTDGGVFFIFIWAFGSEFGAPYM